MNVILVNGIYDLIPYRSLGPYLVRHYLEKRGYSTQVIDHCQEYTGTELLDLIEHFITDDTICVGFSTTFWRDLEKKIWNNGSGIPEALYYAIALIKQKYPNIKIVLGGAGTRYTTTQIEQVDAFVVGEAEDLFPELLDYWIKGTEEPPVSYGLNKPYYKKCINKTYNIETCDFMWSDRDCILHGEPLPMETARGCIFKCKFCAYPHLGKNKFDYLKPLEQIKNQMLYNYDKWGVRHYLMMDDTFNDSEYKIDNFLDMTRSLPFKIGYVAYIRADLVHRFTGMAEKLQESGLESAMFGLESLHPIASQAVGKGWSGKHAQEYIPHLIHNIWNDRVNVILGFIAGLPGEDADSLRDTMSWLNKNNLFGSFQGLGIVNIDSMTNSDTISYSSEFERDAEKYGYKFDKNGVWYNEHWTSLTAAKFAVEEMTYKRKIKRLSSWHHLRFYAFYTEEEIWNLVNGPLTNNEILVSEDFINRKKTYIRNYKEKLKQL